MGLILEWLGGIVLLTILSLFMEIFFGINLDWIILSYMAYYPLIGGDQ